MSVESVIGRAFAAIEMAIRNGKSYEEIADFMVNHDSEAIEADIRSADDIALEYARANNLDVLTSGQRGKKSIAELAASNPFWLGLAAQCGAVGIASTQAGISGVHYASVTYQDIREAWLTLFKSGRDKALQEVKFIRSADHRARVARMVPLDQRKKRLSDALDEAYSLYRSLPNSQRSTPWVCITGLNFGTMDDRVALTKYAQNAVQQIVHTQAMDLRIGTEGGVVYGGPQSKRFPKPSIITGQY